MSLVGWAAGAATVSTASALWIGRRKNLHLWLPPYLARAARQRGREPGRRIHVFLSVCDHYEPEWGHPTHREAVARVDRWCSEYPALFSSYRDSLGNSPQHTFFFPQDQYHADYLDRLADLCRAGHGDVDVHLHHDHDTSEGLTEKLLGFRETLWERHGLLRRCPQSNRIVYGFIHGNWALCNSRHDGRWCGVDDEIRVLLETGCYADFTLPSAPSETQTRTVNSIYYARQHEGPKSHDQGVGAQVGAEPPPEHLLMIQGPLCPDWRRRKFGLLPRVENSDIHAGMPPTWRRMQMWMNCGVHVAGRPDWLFVKLHTHGCKPSNADTLLGDPMVNFHESLQREQQRNPALQLHYVTAWETAQLVHAAEQGSTDPAEVLRALRIGGSTASPCHSANVSPVNQPKLKEPV